ncbi:MAG: DUF882 domain-containing protein [Labilithrix sp.]|nr:DUF882 domain-containing protein [Labilithrix sp.]MBX3222535.1 DUF882 domain-containing protein [Labilithrix sp.]
MRRGLTSIASIVALGVVIGLCPAVATADVQHTIGKGHTIQAIANRYRVTPKSIIEANRLTDRDVKRLKIGDVLTIPKVDPPKDAKGKDKDAKGKPGKEPNGKAAAKPTTFAAKAKTPGVIHIRRAASTEEADLRITDKSGKIAPTTLKSMEKMMRAAGGASHPVEARLVSLLGIVSNHFGSRKIEVISGFRPYTPTQYTQHSNHNHGKAIDFRVVGVPNEVVRDFCRTLKNVGCGYYPNSTFVHMDVRETSAFWIDYSKPGEPPRYNAANVEADEGTSDVQSGDAHPGANTAPPDVTPEPAPGSDTTNESDPPPATKPSDED